MTDTDWIREGAQVAEYDHNNLRDQVALTTIAKLTNTQIVLDNGNRYRRDNLRKAGEKRSTWSGWTELRPADDRRVKDTYAQRTLDALLYKLEKLPRSSIRTEADVLAALDEIERAVTAARNTITGKE